MLFLTAELRALLGTPISDERAELAHELAEDAILGEVGVRISVPPQHGIKTVALSIAARILTNPQGLRSEQAGGMLQSYADSQTGVILSDDERRRLRRAVGMASGAGMLSISPTESRISTYPWRQA